MELVLACQNGKPPGATQVWLENDGSGNIILKGKNEAADNFKFYLLALMTDGTVLKYSGISPELGFELDPSNRLKTKNE